MSIHRLSLLDTYKVRWDAPTVVRDVVQNFFDAAGSLDRVRIEVDKKKKTVRIEGPTVFALDLLRYLGGTTKSASDLRSAGGFGEGFKICALVLLRDFGVGMEAGAGDWRIRPFLDEVHYEGGILGRELCYAAEPVEPPFPGSTLSLTGVPNRLARRFEQAAELFHDPKNPRLLKPFFVDEGLGIGLYHSPEENKGEVYYRRQIRSRLSFKHGAALSVAYDDRLTDLDADRDRRHIATTGPILVRLCLRLPDEVLLRLLDHLRRYWAGGNSLLRAAVHAAAERGLKLTTLPKRWLANAPQALRFQERAKRKGFKIALAAFAELGLPSLITHFGAAVVPRPPTEGEQRRIAILAELYHRLTGHAAPRIPLEVQEEPLVDGYGRYNGVFSAPSLAGDFAVGAAAGLAVLACVRGAGKENNGDRLTELIEGALAQSDALDDLRARWEAAELAQTAPEDRLLEVFDDKKHDHPVVQVAVYSVPGLPIDPLLAAIREAARRERVAFRLTLVPILDLHHAHLAACRGLPTVRIHHRDVLTEGAAPRTAFTRRHFAGAAWPTAEALQPPLRQAWIAAFDYKRGRRRRWADQPAWALKGEKAELAYRRRHDTEALARDQQESNIRAAVEARLGGRSPGVELLMQQVKRGLETQPAATWPEHLPALLDVWTAPIQAFEAAIVPFTPPPASGGSGAHPRFLMARAIETLAAGASLDDALAELSRGGAAFLTVCAEATDLPIRSDDARSVRGCAQQSFGRAWLASPEPATALACAREVVAEGIRLSGSWQPPPQAEGQRYGFGEALARHIGAYPPTVIERAFAAVERITPRVRSAMEAARAQGADERGAEEAGFQACAAALHEEADPQGVRLAIVLDAQLRR